MRPIPYFIAIVLLILTTAAAADLDRLTGRVPVKPAPTGAPVAALPRQGGDTVETAVAVPALPFADSGTTVGYNDDYDVPCPYGGHVAPDVVYVYTAPADLDLTVDLCGSSYDTRTWVYDEDLNYIACNDDYYEGPPCGAYVSRLDYVPLAAGATYYIVIDGYSSDCGPYELLLEETATCEVEIPAGAIPEGEPEVHNGYVDEFNSGCGGQDVPFSELAGDAGGEVIVAATSGWYTTGGSPFFDTDWYSAVVGAGGTVEVELNAEQRTAAMHLAPTDCYDYNIVQDIVSADCLAAGMTIVADPGSEIWIWVGPENWSPSGESPFAFDYTLRVSGLEPTPIAAESVPWGGLKSLYR